MTPQRMRNLVAVTGFPYVNYIGSSSGYGFRCLVVFVAAFTPRPDVMATTVGSLGPAVLGNEDWDAVDLTKLLQLKETRFINPQIGYPLRHYWLPATDLTIRESNVVRYPNKDRLRTEGVTFRVFCKCRADQVVWSDRRRSFYVGKDASLPFDDGVGAGKETLHVYNRSQRTLRTRERVSRNPLTPKDADDARYQALTTMPLVYPIGPMQLGDSWTRSANDASMTYRIASQAMVGSTAVVIIERQGYFISRGTCLLNDSVVELAYRAERKGITVFAYNRSVVLEDRSYDVIVEANALQDQLIGTSTKAVARLIRSESRRSG